MGYASPAPPGESPPLTVRVTAGGRPAPQGLCLQALSAFWFWAGTLNMKSP